MGTTFRGLTESASGAESVAGLADAATKVACVAHTEESIDHRGGSGGATVIKCNR